MKIRRAWVPLACLLLAAPSYLLAGPPGGAGKGFPNDQDAGAHNIASTVGIGSAQMSMDMHINLGCPAIRTGEFPMPTTTPGEDGADVATESVNQLCAAAIGAGYIVSSLVPSGCDGTVPNCCTDATTSGTRLQLQKTCGPTVHGMGVPLRVFEIDRDPNATSFIAKPITDAVITSLQHDSTAGNTITDDLLHRYILRVDPAPSGVRTDGIVTVSFLTDASDPNSAVTVSQDTTGLDDLQLHSAIAAQMNALGIGLNAHVLNRTSAEQFSFAPSDLKGYFIHIPNMTATGVQVVTTAGQTGQLIVAETVGEPSDIPTLSEWGILTLIALLLTIGTWMALRRRADQQA